MIHDSNESSLKAQAGGKFSTVQVSWFGRYEKSKSPLQSASFSIPRLVDAQTKFDGSKVTWQPHIGLRKSPNQRESAHACPYLSKLAHAPMLAHARMLTHASMLAYTSPCLHMPL